MKSITSSKIPMKLYTRSPGDDENIIKMMNELLPSQKKNWTQLSVN